MPLNNKNKHTKIFTLPSLLDKKNCGLWCKTIHHIVEDLKAIGLMQGDSLGTSRRRNLLSTISLNSFWALDPKKNIIDHV